MTDFLPARTWLWIGAAFYAAAFLSATWAVFRSRSRARGLLLVIVGLGLLAQTFGLQQRGIAAHGCPLGNTLEVIQFIVWSLTVLYMVVGTAFRVSLLGYFTSGLAAIMSVSSLLVPRWDGPRRPPLFGGEPWVEAHASLALFAYGAFGTLALTSLMFLLQTFSLKRKRLRGVFGFLPSIVALETINYRLLLTGLVVLSVSLALGTAYFAREPDSIGPAKLLIATGVWAAYLAVLVLRARRLLVSNGLAWACLALFLVALLSLGPINAGLKRKDAPPPSAVTSLPP
jgi:HemX protein